MTERQRGIPEEKYVGEGKSGAGAAFRRVLENFVGPVPDDVADDARVVLKAIRTADALLDATQDDTKRRSNTDNALSHLSGTADQLSSDDPSLQDAMAALRERISQLPEEQQSLAITSYASILRVTEKLRTVTDPTEFARLTMLEGQMSARPFLDLIPDEIKQRPGYNGEAGFARWLTRMGRFANAVDTAVDLKSDVEDGQVSVRPTLRNRAVLIKEALPAAAAGLRRFPPREYTNLAKSLYITILASKRISPSK